MQPPLSSLDPPLLDSELPSPISLLEESPRRTRAVENGFSGLLCVLAFGLLLAVVGYSASYVVEFLPWATT